MTVRPLSKSLTLGVCPNGRGFGWIAFEAPFAAYDWGLVFVRGDKNRRSMRAFENLLDRLQPETLVLEATNPKVQRTVRMESLHQAMAAAAQARNIEVAVYPRDDVLRCYATVGARTRQEVAEAVARQIDVLAHKLPRTRGDWRSQDRRMALFSAAALVQTHYQLGANTLFEGLMDAS
ncbi:hypothetical protein [Phenylobacterium aquaticum]|uniref:hypothetical protein n=1 Tax=Phenylobacterium aquaticum TaxID=1763816 RepID=UPI001F5C9CD0|nr:hypothetical protein [Phenylobacterium aquaticum]MCI3133121.1 hypothetical protein [Phenylobacterium aquaticum]